jgi:hypothetical protein
MEDNIFGIIEQLTKHDISKTEAVKKLLFLYNVVESKPSTKAALNASVKAIWFNDSADYLRFHYKVVSSLTGLEEPTDEDIDRLYDELNPE